MKWLKLIKLVTVSQCALYRHLNVKKGSKPSVFYTFDLEMCFTPQRRAFFDISTFSISKSGPRMVWMHILTWKCAPRHNGVHFFGILTSKSGLRPSFFNTFDLEMCFAPQRGPFFSTSELPSVVRALSVFYTFDLEMRFAPQRRAFFRHLNILNFQKWSENGVLCTFWLGNVLRAKTACSFSTS